MYFKKYYEQITKIKKQGKKSKKDPKRKKNPTRKGKKIQLEKETLNELENGSVCLPRESSKNSLVYL